MLAINPDLRFVAQNRTYAAVHGPFGRSAHFLLIEEEYPFRLFCTRRFRVQFGRWGAKRGGEKRGASQQSPKPERKESRDSGNAVMAYGPTGQTRLNVTGRNSPLP